MSKIEQTFTVDVPVGRVWDAFTQSEQRSLWEAEVYEIDPRPGGAIRWTLPGMEATGVVDEVVPNKRLVHRETSGPHTSAQITVTFEEVEAGTKVTIVHSGFGDGADLGEWLEGTSLGWAQAIRDLNAYLLTGVPARRFASEMQSPGMQMHDTDAGIVVDVVEPGGMADQAGLHRGDLVLRVGNAPVFAIAELWVLMRLYPAGTTLEIEYVRDGERRDGKGTIGGWFA